jgi:hypothetical protein
MVYIRSGTHTSTWEWNKRACDRGTHSGGGFDLCLDPSLILEDVTLSLLNQ